MDIIIAIGAVQKWMAKGERKMRDKSMLEATIIILIEWVVAAIAGILMYSYAT